MEITKIGEIIIYIANFFILYLNIIWLLTLWENKNGLYRPKLKRFFPKVCVIVPCFNEEKNIIKTAHSLLRLDYPQEKLEILIIDDGSTDKTYLRAKSLERYSQIKVFRKKRGGKYTALNYGLEKTTAEFIGCLDADSFVSRQALRLIMTYFEEKKTMAVTASVKVHQPQNIFQHIQKIEYILGIYLRKVFSLFDSIIVTPGPFTIFRREVFEKLGPFRQGHHTEDLEIAFRLQDANYRIANAPNASVYTIAPASLWKLFRQRKRWYQGLIRNAWDYRHIFLNRKYGDLGLFVLPATFLTILVLMVVLSYHLFLLSQEIIWKFLSWQAIGFDFSQTTPQIDWFFINTQMISLLGILLLAVIIGLIYLGKELARDKSKIIKSLIFFLFLYSPFYFICWLSAIQLVILKKEIKW